jgi:hypothetical protein
MDVTYEHSLNHKSCSILKGEVQQIIDRSALLPSKPYIVFYKGGGVWRFIVLPYEIFVT